MYGMYTKLLELQGPKSSRTQLNITNSKVKKACLTRRLNNKYLNVIPLLAVTKPDDADDIMANGEINLDFAYD